MKWVTRARPKTDRIACPWLIRRFIDPEAEILYVPADQVLAVAASEGARSFDAPDTDYTHRDGKCSLQMLGDCTRAATIPSGKSLFIALLDSEWSSLETAGTPVCTNVQDASCQLANATYFADHIVDLFFEIDGSRLARPSSFRFVNPQINFFAPCPDWIFKSVPNARPSQPPAQACGPATSTGDGYFVFVNPLSAGQHKIHYGGAFKFTQKNDGFDAYFPIDITYSLTAQ